MVGDEGIKMAASTGDYNVISPLIDLSLWTLIIAVIGTFIFSIITLFF